MADSENHSAVTVENRPLRNLRPRINSPASKHGHMPTPPTTPRRSKRRVQLSGSRRATERASSSSGLTPILRRTTFLTATPADRHFPVRNLWNRGGYGIPISGTIQFEPLRQVLGGRVTRRLRRRGLSEEANDIEWEDRREVKRLRMEIEQLRGDLEAKCVELQVIRDAANLTSQEESRDSNAANLKLTARVRELEQQVADLKAELQQMEDESENFGDVASRDLPSLDEDDGQVITNRNLQENAINDDISIELDTCFLSPPPTMPNTPYKHSSSSDACLPATNPDPAAVNEALNNQLQSELGLRGEIGFVNHARKTTRSSLVRVREEMVGMETLALGVGERRQGRRWTRMLAPCSSRNGSED